MPCGTGRHRSDLREGGAGSWDWPSMPLSECSPGTSIMLSWLLDNCWLLVVPLPALSNAGDCQLYILGINEMATVWLLMN